MDSQDLTKFQTATIPRTIVPVSASQQASARRLVRAGWCGYGRQDLIEAVGRPRKARDGGRLFGAVVREREQVAA